MMEQALGLDNLLAACTALSALVVIYGGWICLAELNNPLEKKGASLADPNGGGRGIAGRRGRP